MCMLGAARKLGMETEGMKPSLLETLKILSHPDYHLVDVCAYPMLCKVYTVAVAISIVLPLLSVHS